MKYSTHTKYFLIGMILKYASTVEANASEEGSNEEITISNNKASISSKGSHHGQYSGGTKGDTTVPTSSRYTSSRAYVDERKRDGYRYYGTGSKSGNSFLPTNIHKSTSLDSHNYFVTTKSNIKDLETAGSGLSTGGAEGNNYLTVYESPAMMNGGSGSASAVLGMEEPFGDMAAETGMGGGWGHGGGGYGGGGKGCNSALGLLGVLGLAAYLQNVLRNMQNGTAGRRRRDISLDSDPDLESKLEKVRTGILHLADFDDVIHPLNDSSRDMNLDEETYRKVMGDVFPLLSAVAHAKDGLIPIHCTHSSVCLANQVLVDDLGILGRTIAIKITAAIAKFLTKLTKDEHAEQIRMITKAGKMGRNGRNCKKVFPTCNRLRKLPTYHAPAILENQK